MANIIDYLIRIKEILATENWKESGIRFFGPQSILISAKSYDLSPNLVRPPTVLIYPLNARMDNQRPQLQFFTVRFTVYHYLAGDQFGEWGLIGRQYPATLIENAGILEITEELKLLIQNLNRSNGIPIQGFTERQFEMVEHTNHPHIYKTSLDCQVRVTTE